MQKYFLLLLGSLGLLYLLSACGGEEPGPGETGPSRIEIISTAMTSTEWEIDSFIVSRDIITPPAPPTDGTPIPDDSVEVLPFRNVYDSTIWVCGANENAVFSATDDTFSFTLGQNQGSGQYSLKSNELMCTNTPANMSVGGWELVEDSGEFTLNLQSGNPNLNFLDIAFTASTLDGLVKDWETFSIR